MPAFNPPIDRQEINSSFSDYEILDSIGEGGQGSVWKVRLANSRIGALKVYSQQGSFQKRASREVDALRNLDSEFIVDLIESGEIEIRNSQCLYTVTEFISGQNLRDKIRNNNSLPESLVKEICRSIALAIDEIWSLRIVHRDIKPQNILIDQNDEIYLIDLGIAKHLDETTLTQYGRILGTPGYMSPEQMENRNSLTRRSDLFSLGLVAYESLSGQHPFNGRQDLVNSYSPTALEDICQVSNDLASAIQLLLKKRTVERPVSGEQFIEQFN